MRDATECAHDCLGRSYEDCVKIIRGYLREYEQSMRQKCSLAVLKMFGDDWNVIELESARQVIDDVPLLGDEK